MTWVQRCSKRFLRKVVESVYTHDGEVERVSKREICRKTVERDITKEKRSEECQKEGL